MKTNEQTPSPATALVIVDIQKDYFAGGAMALHEPDAAARNAARLLQAFRAADAPVIHIQHEMPPERGLAFFLPGTEGQQIHPSVAPLEGETVIIKHLPSAFSGTELEAHLRGLGVTDLVLIGMMTHLCVSSTARAAMERGFAVTVIGDATATRDLLVGTELVPADSVQKANLASLAGIIATITDTGAYLQSFAPATIAATP